MVPVLIKWLFFAVVAPLASYFLLEKPCSIRVTNFALDSLRRRTDQ